MDSRLELDVLIFPDEVRIATPEDLREWELETASQISIPTLRLFVALYPYNPAAMSPNHETAAEELPFVPGQIIKVFGDQDSDGFYRGESGGLSGYVPSNMVAEVPVDDEYLKHLLLQQGFIPVDHAGIGLLSTEAQDQCFSPTDVDMRGTCNLNMITVLETKGCAWVQRQEAVEEMMLDSQK